MRRAISWLAVLALPAVALLGSPASAQKKKGAANKDLDDKNSEKMIKAGVLVGRIDNVYEASRKVRLRVPVPITTLDAGAVSGVQQAQVSMALARARRDLMGMRQAQLQLIQNQARLYRIDVRTVDLEVEAIDDAVVRTAQPKVDFDDRGRPKKLTKAERRELKGPDKNLPGYKAEFGDVAVDQIVRVQLVRKKGEAAAKAKAKPKLKAKPKGKKAKDDDEIGPADVLGEYTPQVSMIVILGEAGGR